MIGVMNVRSIARPITFGYCESNSILANIVAFQYFWRLLWEFNRPQQSHSTAVAHV